jgi:hypothetical protein
VKTVLLKVKDSLELNALPKEKISDFVLSNGPDINEVTDSILEGGGIVALISIPIVLLLILGTIGCVKCNKKVKCF